MFTVKEAALILKVKPNTIYTWIRQKRIEVIRFRTGKRPRVRITQEQINKFMQV